MMNMDITSKSAYKLLQQLESDPQLQSVEDTSILNDELYPTSFESAITNGIRSSLTFGKIGLPTFVWAPLRLHSKVMKILPL